MATDSGAGPEEVGQARSIAMSEPGLEARPGAVHGELVDAAGSEIVEGSPQPAGAVSLAVGKPQSGHDAGKGCPLPLGEDRQRRLERRLIEGLDDAGRKQPGRVGPGGPLRRSELR